MNLTNTKNSELGRAVSFDASYIGRIRSGKRGIPKHQPIIEPAAAYFARNLKEGYQKKAAQDLLCGGRPLPEDKGALTKLIVSFLLSDTLSESDSVGRFIKDLSNLQPAPVLPPMAENGNALRSDLLQKSGAECFYGNAGKRKAVELFLTELLSLKTPVTFLLHSDEDMSWLYRRSCLWPPAAWP